MREDIKLSEAILKIIADDESYPDRITESDIRNSDAIKENFKDINDEKIVFHAKMLKEEGLIKASFPHDTPYLAIINRLTKKGSDYVKYIESPFWKQAIKDLENTKKPLTMKLVYSVCEKLINKK